MDGMNSSIGNCSFHVQLVAGLEEICYMDVRDFLLIRNNAVLTVEA